MAAKQEIQNKAAEPLLTTTGVEAAAVPELTAAETKRQQELAQSGYRLPAEFFAGEAERVAHDKAVAKGMPSTKPQ